MAKQRTEDQKLAAKAVVALTGVDARAAMRLTKAHIDPVTAEKLVGFISSGQKRVVRKTLKDAGYL